MRTGGLVKKLKEALSRTYKIISTQNASNYLYKMLLALSRRYPETPMDYKTLIIILVISQPEDSDPSESKLAENMFQTFFTGTHQHHILDDLASGCTATNPEI